MQGIRNNNVMSQNSNEKTSATTTPVNQEQIDSLKKNTQLQNCLILLRRIDPCSEARLLGFLTGKVSLEEYAKFAFEDTGIVNLLMRCCPECLMTQLSLYGEPDLHYLSCDIASMLTAILQSEPVASNNIQLQIKNLLSVVEKDNDKEKPELQNADLSNLNLQGINLRWANLRKANLQGTNLQEANLQDVCFYKANLQKANLHKASLGYADFSKANLQKADLSETNLVMALFNEANLSEANLLKSSLGRTSFHEAILLGAESSDSDVQSWITEQEHEALWKKFKVLKAGQEEGIFNSYNKIFPQELVNKVTEKLVK